MGLSGAANHFDHRIIRWISTLEGVVPPRIVIAILLLTFPMAALADLTETTILETNSALNLDTGAVVGSAATFCGMEVLLPRRGARKRETSGK